MWKSNLDKRNFFKIYLVDGDSCELRKEITLKDLLNEIKEADEWIVFEHTAIQKIHIKRITEFK